MRASAAVILLMIWCLPASALSPSVSYADAERAFSQLAIGERFLFKVLLTTAGYWPAVADADFSRGLLTRRRIIKPTMGFPQQASSIRSFWRGSIGMARLF